jgi:hypothetical protein
MTAHQGHETRPKNQLALPQQKETKLGIESLGENSRFLESRKMLVFLRVF